MNKNIKYLITFLAIIVFLTAAYFLRNLFSFKKEPISEKEISTLIQPSSNNILTKEEGITIIQKYLKDINIQNFSEIREGSQDGYQVISTLFITNTARCFLTLNLNTKEISKKCGPGGDE